MLARVQIGRLEGPLAPVSGRGMDQLVRGWAVTSRGAGVVVAKRVQRYQLVREVLGSLLAQVLDLPTPTPYVLDATMSNWPTADANRYVFATEYQALGDLSRRAVQAPETSARLAVWRRLPRVIAFDTWIANGERHARTSAAWRSSSWTRRHRSMRGAGTRSSVNAFGCSGTG